MLNDLWGESQENLVTSFCYERELPEKMEKQKNSRYTHEKQELENRVFWNLSISLDKSNFISRYLTKLNIVHKKKGENLSVK